MSSPRPAERGLNSAMLVAVGTISMQVLIVVSGIIGARMLGVEGRGQVALVTAISGMASVLTLGSSLPSAIATELARRGVTARDGLRRLFPRWCVLAWVPALLAGGYILLVMDSPTELQRVLLAALTVIAALQAMAARVLVGALQGELASIARMMFASLLPLALSTVLLVVAFIVGWDWDVVDLLTAQAAMWTLGLLLSMRFLRQPRRDPADEVDGRNIRQLARANYVGTMAPIDGLGFDRTLIGTLMGNSALGLYAAAIALGNLPGLIGSAVGAILLPRVAAQQSLPARRRLIASWLAAAAAGTAVVVVLLVLTAGPLIHFAFGDEFMGAVEVARWLVVAQGILGFRRVFIMALQGLGRGAVASAVELVLTVVMIAGVVFAALQHSLVGAAMVMLGVGSLSCFILAAILGQALRGPSPGAGSRVLLVELGGGGHRFYPVRLLAEEALSRGALVTVLTRVDPVTRQHLDVHLGELLDRIEVVELESPTWSDVERVAKSRQADITVVTEADHYLLRILLRAGWRGTGKLSLLVMRVRVPSVGTPIRSGLANIAKILSVNALWVMPRIRLRVLRGQMWRSGGWWPSVNDPATLVCSSGDVGELRRAWALDPDRFWIGALGAVTENKNLPLVADAVAALAAERPVGLLVAGRISPSLQPSIPALRDQLTAAGAQVVVHDRILTDLELDAAVAGVDVLALAYSHNGPSGTFGKALLAGTKVVAAGSPALRTDCLAAPEISTWVPLRAADVAQAFRDAMDQPAAEPVHVPGAKEFTTALLGPAVGDDQPAGPSKAELLAAEEDSVHLQDPTV